MMKVFIISLLVCVSGCTTAEVPECINNVLTSTREFIRVEHPMNKNEQVRLIAKKWCQSQDLVAEKSKSYCSGCCITVFQCR